MARRRYGRRKGRRGGRRAIPVLSTLPVLLPAIKTYQAVGISKSFPDYMLWQTTGYSTTDGKFNTGILTQQAGLVLLAIVGHKVANKFGINKAMKRLTMGMLQL